MDAAAAVHSTTTTHIVRNTTPCLWPPSNFAVCPNMRGRITTSMYEPRDTIPNVQLHWIIHNNF